MNKVILMGRLVRDPEVRYSQGENATAVARYTLAVDRRFNRNNGEDSTDFIGCVAFGRSAEFAEKYLHKGTCPVDRLISMEVAPEDAEEAMKKWAEAPGRVFRILVKF